MDHKNKQVPITDIDISYSIIGNTDNITVDSIMLEDSNDLHLDLLDPGEEKEIFLQILSNNSSKRGETTTVLINYTGKYTDNNGEIKEVTGYSTIDVTIPNKGLIVNPSSFAMGHTLDFETYANSDTGETIINVMSLYNEDTHSFTITNPNKEMVHLRSPDKYFDWETPLNRQIWGSAPESLVKSIIKDVVEVIFNPTSLIDNFGVSCTTFDNGLYTESNSAETDLSYGESTQLKVSSTSLYADLWPTIYDGAIYFGYNWENEENQNYKIPVTVADIGLMGRMIYLNSFYDGSGYNGSSSGYGGYQTINDIVDLPPTVQNEYKIDYGPKVSEFTEARVKLQISQELTLEREAFEASVQLTNKLDKDLTNISISVNIEDENGTNYNDKFFIQSPTLVNIDSINGGGIIESLDTSSMNWIIIPHTDSGGTAESGQKYCVQMHIEGTVDGQPFVADSEKAEITVKPQPKLDLTYYLPKEIVADQPFHLAVKVNNSGYGWGKDLKIASAQPEIIENNADLLLDFEISNSLKVDFGDIAPGEEKIKYWTLESSVPGQFSNFTASFTHSTELGGEQTSIIDGINTEIIDREIVVDGFAIPHVVDSDNDDKPDFILDLLSGNEYTLDNPDILSTDQNKTNFTQSVLISKPREQWICIEIPDIFNGTRPIERVYRSDGMILNPSNYWIENNKVIILDDPEDCYTILYDFEENIVVPTATIDSITLNVANESEILTFQGSGTDSDGSIVGYNWTSSIDGQLSTSANFSTSDLSVGTHFISFSVQDDDGAWSDAVSTTLIIEADSTIFMAESLGFSNTTGMEDGTVSIPLEICNVSNGPLQAITCDIQYNDSILLLESATTSSLTSGWITSTGTNNHSITLTTSDSNSAIPNSSSGDICNLQFRVVGQSDDSTTIYPYNINISSSSNLQGTALSKSGIFTVNSSGNYNVYDLNENCIIDISEISAAVDDFFNGQLSISEISELVDYFLSGEEYW